MSVNAKINLGDLHPVEKHLLFFQEHSLAITQWAMLEQALGRLVAAGFPDRETSQAIFNAFFGIGSFRSKLEFADRYLQLRLVGDELGLRCVAPVAAQLGQRGPRRTLRASRAALIASRRSSARVQAGGFDCA